MAKQKRVFELAKELGVDSKAIVAKCQAEGVPGIDTHMSTVKLGLAATIREWFSESNSKTAVETADKVDLATVRKPARRRAKAKDASQDASSGDTGTATATLESSDEADGQEGVSESQTAARPEVRESAPAAEAAAEPVAETAAPAPEVESVTEEASAPAETTEPVETAGAAEATAEAAAPEAAAAPEQPTAEAPTADAGETPAPGRARPRAAEDQPSEVTPLGVQNVPTRPTVVAPAGQPLVREKVQLKGPQVVRIEKPDPIQAPRRGPSRGPGGPRTGGGGGGYVSDGSVAGITRSRGPARGRGSGGPEGPVEGDGRGRGAGPGGSNKRRGLLNTRRGRSADGALPTGPTQFSQADLDELDARLKGAAGFIKQRRRDLTKREHQPGQAASPADVGGTVQIEEPITIKSLSAATGIKSGEIIKYLFKRGVMSTINSAIDTEMAMEVALDYDIELEVKQQQTALERLEIQFADRPEVDVRRRPPVVTILGHVDHGKTSLLDRVRKSDIATHEAGGITQHVGAYRVRITGNDGKEKTVVWLDTPGHEAFTSMRARGASMTDIVVLVVAADDGVMPQTIESINHAKAAGVPIVVALNKIDKPEVTEDNIRRIYGQLAEHGLNPTEWGGDTEVMKVSAETGQGVTELLEVLDYTAELKEYKADYGGPARGTVIEAEMQPGRGAVGRVLVQAGQLKVGDTIVIGRAFGRVRDMVDDRGNRIAEAGPATPLEISGIDSVPDAGDKMYATDSLQRAEEIATAYREAERQKQLASKTKVTLDNFSEQIKAGQMRELRIVLKADVQGSMDVLRKSLEDITSSQEVGVRVLHSAVGGVTESDVLLADASDAIIIGFHVTATSAVREIADARGVDIRLYRVIYEITDDIKKSLEGMLEPERKETELGSAEVRATFKVSKIGTVAGCLVTSGVIQRGAKMRLVRDGVVITENREIDSLKRVKDDAREVRQGTECGIRLAGFDDVKPGDRLVCYQVTEVKRTLD